MKQIMLANGEILVSLCKECKCCIPLDGHCYVCHTEQSIDKMCGCGNCPAMAKDYAEREAMRIKNRSWRSSPKRAHIANLGS